MNAGARLARGVEQHLDHAVAARMLAGAGRGPVICLAAAHPAKFPQAVAQAVGETNVATHPTLAVLADAPQRKAELPADLPAVRDYIRAHGRGQLCACWAPPR